MAAGRTLTLEELHERLLMQEAHSRRLEQQLHAVAAIATKNDFRDILNVLSPSSPSPAPKRKASSSPELASSDDDDGFKTVSHRRRRGRKLATPRPSASDIESDGAIMETDRPPSAETLRGSPTSHKDAAFPSLPPPVPLMSVPVSLPGAVSLSRPVAKTPPPAPLSSAPSSVRPAPANSAASANSAATAPPSASVYRPPGARRPPPVVLRARGSYMHIKRMCAERGISVSSTSSKSKLNHNLHTPSIDDYRRLTELLDSLQVPYHTYTLHEDREVRAVIRGIPHEIDVEDVLDDLRAQGLHPISVHRMHNRSGKTYDMVIAKFPHGDNAIFAVKHICGITNVKVEHPYPRTMPGQCHRCQTYGHSSANCRADFRCVKCLIPHRSSDCPRNKATDGPPACVLCGEAGHPANYRGCPKAPRPRPNLLTSRASRPAFIPAPLPQVNAWHARQQAAQQAPKPATARAPQQAPKPAAAPAPTPRPSGPQSGISASDISYVKSVLFTIDIDEITLFIGKMRAAVSFSDKLIAISQHPDLAKHLQGKI